MFQWIKNIFKTAGTEVWDITKKAAGEAIGKGAEGGVKIIVEKITADPHGEIVSDIKKLLDEKYRQVMFKRLLRHTAEYRENRTANLLLKIPQGQRKEVFEWLCWLNDDQFEQVLNLLENNKVEEFLARNWSKIKPKIEPFRKEIDCAAKETAASLENVNNQLITFRDRVKSWALK